MPFPLKTVPNCGHMFTARPSNGLKRLRYECEVISINEYMTSETKLPAYLPYPRFLLSFDLTLTAKLVYALLLDRTTLSQKNGWFDEAGHIYVLFTLKCMAEAINRSTMSVKKALNELQTAELIERKHYGFSMPNRIFVKLPPYGKKTVSTVERNLSIIGKENCPSYGKNLSLRWKGNFPLTT